MTAPTMEQMLWVYDAELFAFDCGHATKEDVAEARNALLARYAELERERDAYKADAAIGAIARANMCETGYGWQFKAFQVYGAPSLETLEDAAIAQRGGNDA